MTHIAVRRLVFALIFVTFGALAGFILSGTAPGWAIGAVSVAVTVAASFTWRVHAERGCMACLENHGRAVAAEAQAWRTIELARRLGFQVADPPFARPLNVPDGVVRDLQWVRGPEEREPS